MTQRRGGVRLLHPAALGAPRAVATSGHVEDAQDDLAALYAHPLPTGGRGAWVRANLVSSVDGAVAGPDGSSRSLSSPLDLRLLVLLRSLADVVLVGAGTARAEAYRPLRVRPSLAPRRAALGQATAPSLAVVTRTGDLPPTLLGGTGRGARRSAADAPPVLVVTCAAAGDQVLGRLRSDLGEDAVLVTGDTAVHLPTAVHQVAQRGFRRLLCEGGPALLAGVVDADLLDELCLTTSPRLVAGDGPRALVGPAVDARLRLTAALLDEDDGTFCARWTVDRP